MKARLGQHFLKNPSAIQDVIRALNPKAGETAIEIGAGGGELTFLLAEACRRANAKLVAVEKDARLAGLLRVKLASQKNTQVVEGDIRKVLPRLTLDAESYAIVGNIPYYITGILLRRIAELPRRPERAVLMVQEEVAERIAAEPPKMNKLAASVRWWAEPKIILRLPPQDFSPPPKVRSAVVLFAPIGKPLAPRDLYFKAVRALFAQPRKTAANNWRAAFPKMTLPEAEKTLAQAGLEASARPQDLSAEDIARLARLA